MPLPAIPPTLPDRTPIAAQVNRVLARVDVSAPVARIMAAHAFGVRLDDHRLFGRTTEGASRHGLSMQDAR